MAAITDAPQDGLGGEPDAVIRELYSDHAKALHGYVEQFCPDRTSADDIVQETVLLLTAAALDLTRCGLVMTAARHPAPTAGLIATGLAAAALTARTARGCRVSERWAGWHCSSASHRPRKRPRPASAAPIPSPT